MKKILLLVAVCGLLGPLKAGVTPTDHEDDDLLPGDFGKPVIIHLLPGGSQDPWRIDDPIIIIDDDGPSEDDQGIIYLVVPERRPGEESMKSGVVR